jgi:hypothetical protein
MVINHNYLGLRVYPIRVYPGAGWAHRAVDAYSRVYPPLDGNRGAVCGSTHSQMDLHISKTNRPFPKKIFHIKLRLEFVDTKSKERTWLDILCVGH